MRFDALISKFKSHGDDIAFPEPLISLQLLNASNVEDNHRVRILAASVNSMKVNEETSNTTQNTVFVKNITYDAIAGVLRQCDATKDGSRSLGASAVNTTADSRTGGGRFGLGRVKLGGKGRRRPEEIARLKCQMPCHECKKIGHWLDAQNADGTLKTGTHSHYTAQAATAAQETNVAKNGSGGRKKDEANKPVLGSMVTLKHASPSA